MYISSDNLSPQIENNILDIVKMVAENLDSDDVVKSARKEFE